MPSEVPPIEQPATRESEPPFEIWIVEDDLDVLELMILDLHHLRLPIKIHITHFDRADSAIEALKSLAMDQQPSLIIMDGKLPGMSGLEAVKAIRSMRETVAQPLILANSDDPDTNMRMVEQGATAASHGAKTEGPARYVKEVFEIYR